MSRLIRIISGIGLYLSGHSLLWAAAPDVLTREFDWVQLKSGEWLKGEVTKLQDDSFTFDRDILNDLEIDWEEVAQLHTAGAATIGMNDASTAIGRIIVDAATVTVANQAGSKEIVREELRSIIPGGRKECDFWKIKTNLGGTFRSGNVDQADATAAITIERRTPATRRQFDYDATHPNVSGIETANNSRITSSFDYYMTPRLFLQIPTLQSTRDPF